MNLKNRHIGEVSRQLGMSADALRYYEKIGLLQGVGRTVSGIRIYDDKDISRLKFIKRAQKMDFSLAEISKLLQMRGDPQHARTEVRELTRQKLVEISNHLRDLTLLRDELTLLVNLCQGSESGCPIINTIEEDESRVLKS